MKLILGLSTLSLISMFAIGCTDNPEPEVNPTTEPPQESSVAAEPTPEEVAVKAEKLEVKRKSVEDMINQIMQEDVYFDFDKHGLSEKARDILSKIGDVLLEAKEFSVVVEGHTDNQGTEAYNMSLGGKRAKAVYEFLISYGIDASRLKTMSFGEEKPKADGEGDKERELNRRAHFKVEVIK